MSSMQTAQINVRIDRTLKEAGDAALASAGFSPSEAVRALWQKAAARGASLEEVIACLRNELGQHPRDAEGCQADPFEENRWLVVERMKQIGVTDFATPVSSNDDELYEQAMVERLQDRGLL